jgi:hypothetical protein
VRLSTETSALRPSILSIVARNGSISRVVLSQTLFALPFEEFRGRLLARQAPMALVNEITIASVASNSILEIYRESFMLFKESEMR